MPENNSPVTPDRQSKETLVTNFSAGVSSNSVRRSSRAKALAGAFFGVFALWLACRGVDWTVTWLQIRDVDIVWVLISFTCVLAGLFGATLRWRLLFFPHHKEHRFFDLLNSIVLGQMINLTFPGRAGELVRTYRYGALSETSKVKTLATIFVEKVFDFTLLMLSAALLWLLMGSRSAVAVTGKVLLGIGGPAALLMLLLYFPGSSWERVCSWGESFLPEWLMSRVRRFGGLAAAGLVAVRDGRVHVAAWSLSIAVLLCSVGGNYFLFRAFDFPLSPMAALFLHVGLQIGTAPPSLPGKLGIFQYLCVLALGAFSIEASAALGFSVVLYLVTIVPRILWGCLILARGNSGMTFATNSQIGDESGETASQRDCIQNAECK